MVVAATVAPEQDGSMSEAVKIPVYMSVDEFLAWNPSGDERWQMVDGVPRAMAPPSTVHGKLLARLAQVIGSHLDAQDSPCSVVIEPGIVPDVLASHNFRVPDLAVTCIELEVRQPILAGPVLIAEVLSPSNQSETWSNVMAYATIASVQEILALRSVFIGANLMRRRSDGT